MHEAGPLKEIGLGSNQQEHDCTQACTHSEDRWCSFPGLHHQLVDFSQLLSEEDGDRVAAGKNSLRLSREDLRNLEEHVVGKDISRALILLSGRMISPGIEQLQTQQLQ